MRRRSVELERESKEKSAASSRPTKVPRSVGRAQHHPAVRGLIRAAAGQRPRPPPPALPAPLLDNNVRTG